MLSAKNIVSGVGEEKPRKTVCLIHVPNRCGKRKVNAVQTNFPPFFATITTAERKIGLEKKKENREKKYQEAENYFEGTFKGEKLFMVWDLPREDKAQNFFSLSFLNNQIFKHLGYKL